MFWVKEWSGALSRERPHGSRNVRAMMSKSSTLSTGGLSRSNRR
jgi:hypothetical protein